MLLCHPVVHIVCVSRHAEMRFTSTLGVALPKIDDDGVEWFSENDLAELKSCANEPTFDRFVERVNGCRIDVLHPSPGVENADYIFKQDEVIIELKTIENELGNTEQFREKMNVLNRKVYNRFKKTPAAMDPVVTVEYLKGFIDLHRAPLARIVKKANSQIKSTKSNFGYESYSGVLLLVNDGLKELPPRAMLSTLGRILNGSCSSIRALVYLTNHYVMIPGDDYGRVLWVPMYADSNDDKLVDFVNSIGKAWFDYCEELGQPSDDRRAGPDISLEGSRAAGASFPIG